MQYIPTPVVSASDKVFTAFNSGFIYQSYAKSGNTFVNRRVLEMRQFDGGGALGVPTTVLNGVPNELQNSSSLSLSSHFGEQTVVAFDNTQLAVSSIAGSRVYELEGKPHCACAVNEFEFAYCTSGGRLVLNNVNSNIRCDVCAPTAQRGGVLAWNNYDGMFVVDLNGNSKLKPLKIRPADQRQFSPLAKYIKTQPHGSLVAVNTNHNATMFYDQRQLKSPVKITEHSVSGITLTATHFAGLSSDQQSLELMPLNSNEVPQTYKLPKANSVGRYCDFETQWPQGEKVNFLETGNKCLDSLCGTAIDADSSTVYVLLQFAALRISTYLI